MEVKKAGLKVQTTPCRNLSTVAECKVLSESCALGQGKLPHVLTQMLPSGEACKQKCRANLWCSCRMGFGAGWLETEAGQNSCFRGSFVAPGAEDRGWVGPDT
jgi:hypothetical protein